MILEAPCRKKEDIFMSIRFDPQTSCFTLHTDASTYQMQLDPMGHLMHLYYGRCLGTDSSNFGLYPVADHGFSPDYYASSSVRGSYSPDVLPQEYQAANRGDFRVTAADVISADGAHGAEFTYKSHTVTQGAYKLQGLPTSFGDDCETLTVVLADEVLGLELKLLYGVYAARNVITRAAVFVNRSDRTLTLAHAACACLDLPFGQWDLLHFHGRHAMERQLERTRLGTDVCRIGSVRGASSHHHNPFVILCEPTATEDAGSCYGVMPVYSGNCCTDIERDYNGLTRIVTGIHPDGFCWQLQPGEQFATPQVLYSYTYRGLGELSRQYHRFLRQSLCRGTANQTSQVLINNWEATYFSFDADKIYAIAQKAASLGVGMMVLDDGWFGKRDSDVSGLGDWTVNTAKLQGGLAPLIEKINALGMKFGIWIEPEMVSPDSELYRAHPDWALTLPGRDPILSRAQLVLDMSRPEVVDYLTDCFTKLLSENHIEYIKWDMNRNMADVYSRALPPERQGEVFHRYILGVYRLLDRLTTAFPQVLFEGCAGGGGRFDAGMLAYVPQFWCSDNTDAIERLSIQYGTSFGYPVAAMGAHVSACPNHQTGRTVPLGTRGVVAMSGTFGYELDLNKLSRKEMTQVKGQIKRYQSYAGLIRTGDYYRLSDPADAGLWHAWQFAAPDASEALLNLVVVHTQGNPRPLHIAWKGLAPDGVYKIVRLDLEGIIPGIPAQKQAKELVGTKLTGAQLMYAGQTLPQLYGDYPSAQILIKRVDK